ncbi:uncharacterized protein I303_107800 [Kwoniella dejecticola CBS 10117]|uniref:ER membrane protein complex subunit 2 n=1 Tax=Kwoniella dejecticola CBS 10117 TaxID=1296121 RepID=A0AAJ8KWS0_9TREE
MSSADLETLARWRTIGVPHSEEVIELGRRVLDKGKGVMGDQEWALREQVAIAALDLGQHELSREQIKILRSKFPNSPRVRILDGLFFESQGRVDQAREIYEGLLKIDETNVSAHQRLISLTLSTTSTSTSTSTSNSSTHAEQTTIPLLLRYLDIFYSDPSGWSLLSELYCDLGMYVQSLDALGHLLAIQPWDENAVRRAGEVAYTHGDYQLSLKHLLRSLEMQGNESTGPAVNGRRTRTWWGIKLAVSRLLESSSMESTVPPEMRTTEKQLKLLDELATERLLAISAKGGKGVNLDVIRKVLGSSTAAAGEIIR